MTGEAPEETESDGKKKKDAALNWSKIGVGAMSALAGILGTPYGIYVAAAILALGAVGLLVAKSMFKDWQFENLKKQAGSKTGSEAASNQHDINNNRDAVDDFLGREHRS